MGTRRRTELNVLCGQRTRAPARHLNDISDLIIQAAIEVHRALGPGLLESVYRACLMYELRQRHLPYVAEQLVPLCYKEVILDSAYRLDVLVEDQISTSHCLQMA